MDGRGVVRGVMISTMVLCLLGSAVEMAVGADKEDMGPRSPEKNWSIGFTPSVSQGNFGSNTTSTFVYAPLSIRRLFRDGDVAVVIPFVSATSNGTSTLVGGQPTQTIPGTCLKNGGTVIDTSKPECLAFLNTGGRATSRKVTNSGLGDILLKGRYYLMEEKDFVPLIAVTGRLKLPTASASQGLGTGELDYGFGVELSKLIARDWLLYLDGGYNIIGDPDGLPFQNQYWYDIGAGYNFTDKLLGSVYFEEYRAIVPGFVNARDVFFSANYKASDAWRFNAGLTVGLSNGAPDYGVSIGTNYRF